MFRKLNIKLIVLFIVPLWLFDQAGEILGYLRNPALAEQIRHSKGDMSAFNGEGLTVVNLTDLVLASGIASVLALLVGLIISLIICRKHKWHWINAVLAFVLVYLSGWLKFDGSNYVAGLLRLPGEALDGIWYYVTNGLVCISLGILTFFLISFSKGSNNVHVTVKQQSA